MIRGTRSNPKISRGRAEGQYTAIRYANQLADAGALASIGTVGDSYDNAPAESVIGLYKLECVRRPHPPPGPPAGRTASPTLGRPDRHRPVERRS